MRITKKNLKRLIREALDSRPTYSLTRLLEQDETTDPITPMIASLELSKKKLNPTGNTTDIESADVKKYITFGLFL